MNGLKYIRYRWVFTLLFLGVSIFVQAQEFPPMDASPMDLVLAKPYKDKPPVARVIYSRPQKNNRKIFGHLVPYNILWRTGANEATELRLYQSFMLGDQCLDEGTYTLYTIPKAKSWTIIINRDTNVWGAFSYIKQKDVARIEVPVHQAAAPIEALSMAFETKPDGVDLLIGWEWIYVSIPFKYIP